jgi:hypothetical protein
MTDIGRNSPCPCRSGLKYKRCCLRRRDDVALDAAEAERVWGQMQSWALKRFGDELGTALKTHVDARRVGSDEHPAMDADLSLALCWLLIDRALADDGATPAQLYTRLPELTPSDRETATRIAASGLGLHRVTDVEPSARIVLENVLTGERTRVASPNVSREAVRWHVLLCRVMHGGPTPSLWGAAAFYEPAEEAELLDELRRIAEAHELGADPAALEAALRVGAGELVCFVPPSRRAEPVLYTLEGEPVAMAEASWRLHDPRAAIDALRNVPELTFSRESDNGQDVTLDWLTSRRGLLARRPPLPLGAICMESGPVLVGEDGALEPQDLTSLGTFTLRGDRLEFFGTSEKRLADAVALVERHLGEVANPPERRMRSIDDALAAAAANRDLASPAGSPHTEARDDERPVVPEARIRELTYRRWVDDPNERLAGLSPRAAAARGEHLDELERQLRSFEHHSARERADGRPGPEVTWLHAELSLDTSGLAA